MNIKKIKKNLLTCCSISLNCCSIGLKVAEMTGSLCRHTAASKFHGEVVFSIILLVCKAPRQKEVLKPRRKPLFLAQVPRKWERIGVTARLAILSQGAAIFLCYIQGLHEKNVALRMVINNDPTCFPNFIFYTQFNREFVTVNKRENFAHFLLGHKTDGNFKESVRSPVGLSTILLNASFLYFRPTILCKERTNYSE